MSGLLKQKAAAVAAWVKTLPRPINALLVVAALIYVA